MRDNKRFWIAMRLEPGIANGSYSKNPQTLLNILAVIPQRYFNLIVILFYVFLSDIEWDIKHT